MAPLPILIDLIVTRKVRILTLDEHEVHRLTEKNPSYVREVIPRDLYGKNLVNDKDIMTVGPTSMAATHRGVDPEVVYKITKALFANLDEYYTSHPSARRTSLEDAFTGLVIPLHAGALRYYKEAGKVIPARMIPPEK